MWTDNPSVLKSASGTRLARTMDGHGERSGLRFPESECPKHVFWTRLWCQAAEPPADGAEADAVDPLRFECGVREDLPDQPSHPIRQDAAVRETQLDDGPPLLGSR